MLLGKITFLMLNHNSLCENKDPFSIVFLLAFSFWRQKQVQCRPLEKVMWCCFSAQITRCPLWLDLDSSGGPSRVRLQRVALLKPVKWIASFQNKPHSLQEKQTASLWFESGTSFTNPSSFEPHASDFNLLQFNTVIGLTHSGVKSDTNIESYYPEHPLYWRAIPAFIIYAHILCLFRNADHVAS